MNEEQKVNGQTTTEKMPTMPITLSDTTSYSSSDSNLMCAVVDPVETTTTTSTAATMANATQTLTSSSQSLPTQSSGETRLHYGQQPQTKQHHHHHHNHHHQQHNHHSRNTSTTPSSAATAEQQQQPKRVPGRTVNDYRFGRPIGEGSFSTVHIAEDIHTRKEWAIKICSKDLMVREKKQEYVMRERNALQMLTDCPGIVKMSATFHDARDLYFVITYAKNGDMLPYITKVGSFNREVSRFYAAELVLALERMHCRGVVHRDLKPENILLDEQMHILITDFGSCKIFRSSNNSNSAVVVGSGGSTATTSGLDLCNSDAPEAVDNREDENEDDEDNNRSSSRSRGRKNSFVGTAHYVSPEVLHAQQSGREADLWALGCIIYQMISGLPPFRGASEFLIFQKVLKREFTFPEGFDETAADLVRKLLQISPKDRLGAQDRGLTYVSLRQHPFFDGIEWDTLFQQTPPPIYPYLPGLESDKYRIPDHIKPGLTEQQKSYLVFEDLNMPEIMSCNGIIPTTTTATATANNIVAPTPSQPKSILDITDEEMHRRLDDQRQNNKWHPFADGELILREGFVNKRKGLFARKRMLLLTTGPRLIYIDPTAMVKKGEIAWTSDLRVEPKNFRIFFVHTPNRTYYLEDSEGYNAQQWCNAIDDVRQKTYGIDME